MPEVITAAWRSQKDGSTGSPPPRETRASASEGNEETGEEAEQRTRCCWREVKANLTSAARRGEERRKRRLAQKE